MAPIDKMVESRLLAAQSAAAASELLDPLLMDDAETGPAAAATTAAGGSSGNGSARCLSNARRQLRGFQPMFWVLSVCCLVVYGTILPFNNVASSLLQARRWRVCLSVFWFCFSSDIRTYTPTHTQPKPTNTGA